MARFELEKITYLYEFEEVVDVSAKEFSGINIGRKAEENPDPKEDEYDFRVDLDYKFIG